MWRVNQHSLNTASLAMSAVATEKLLADWLVGDALGITTHFMRYDPRAILITNYDSLAASLRVVPYQKVDKMF